MLTPLDTQDKVTAWCWVNSQCIRSKMSFLMRAMPLPQPRTRRKYDFRYKGSSGDYALERRTPPERGFHRCNSSLSRLKFSARSQTSVLEVIYTRRLHRKCLQGQLQGRLQEGRGRLFLLKPLHQLSAPLDHLQVDERESHRCTNLTSERWRSCRRNARRRQKLKRSVGRIPLHRSRVRLCHRRQKSIAKMWPKPQIDFLMNTSSFSSVLRRRRRNGKWRRSVRFIKTGV
mmetsp:Transcript_99502/g.157453  ORF Transcript_99502/g.157453 Transcript_99502/m.157453 type:complete len:230 (-) Transcript_99502:2161-2850(-)